MRNFWHAWYESPQRNDAPDLLWLGKPDTDDIEIVIVETAAEKAAVEIALASATEVADDLIFSPMAGPNLKPSGLPSLAHGRIARFLYAPPIDALIDGLDWYVLEMQPKSQNTGVRNRYHLEPCLTLDDAIAALQSDINPTFADAVEKYRADPTPQTLLWMQTAMQMAYSDEIARAHVCAE